MVQHTCCFVSFFILFREILIYCFISLLELVKCLYLWFPRVACSQIKDDAVQECYLLLCCWCCDLKREIFLDLAPLLWSSGCVAVLLQEISSIYFLLSPPNLTAGASFRICNTLVLLQCVASHPDTRARFLNAHIPVCLYPFLKTTSKTIPFEYLRVTTLGVISAFFEVDDTQEIAFLLATGIVPLLLRIMLMSGELSKRVATFIVQKIMFNSVGLGYICGTAERFFEVCHVLENMVQYIAEKPSPVLLKHIIRCYLGLTKSSRACACLRNRLPETFRDPSFSNYLGDDTATKQCLHQLLYNLSDDAVQKVKVPTFLRHKL